MKTSSCRQVVLSCLFFCLSVMVPASSNAQDGNFADLYLDGGAGLNPFIRFDQPDNFHHYLVGFSDSMEFYVENGYKFKIRKDAVSESLVLDSDGVSTVDLNVDGRIHVMASPGYVEEFEFNSTGQSFGIRSLDSNSGLYNGGIGFTTSSNFYPLWVFDTARSETLALRDVGVGVGTYTADSALHVYADGSPFENAKVTVENNLVSTGLREMFALVNNGGSRFTMENTNNNTKWAFASDALGRFTFSLDGTGGPEVAVTPNGRVIMGPGSDTNFDLRPNGNLILAGTLTQSSDRNLKTAFEDVDTESVLDKIAKMPITTWQFKKDEPKIRHMGPTAQDFYQSFELGLNERTIAPVDGIGVSLSGIKALNQKVDQLAKKQVEINQLQQKLDDQDQRIQDQTDLIEQLTQRLELLEAASPLN